MLISACVFFLCIEERKGGSKPMISLEELERIKEDTRRESELKKNQEYVKIAINMGTCSIAKGAKETYKAIIEEIKTRGLLKIVVLPTGCIGMCELEPIIEVIKQGGPKVTYGRVTPEKARQIIASHIVNSKVVSELVISVGD